MDRRMLALGAFALLALGLYLGLELLRSPAKAPALAVGVPLPAQPEAMSFEQFMGAFGALEKEPGAVAFAQSFLREPELAEEWKEFQKDKDVVSFVENLKESPAFERVTRKNAASPAFKAAVERALKLLPGLSGLLQGGGSLSLVMGRLPGAEPEAGGSAAVREPQARARPGRAATGRTGRTPPRRPGPAIGQGFGRRATMSGTVSGYPGAQTASFAGAGDERTGGFAASVDARTGKAASSAGPAAGEAGRDAHSTIPLPKVGNAESELMQRLLQLYPWLASLSAEEREALLPLIDQHGLWGACFALKMYARCRDACAASGGMCEVVDGWKSCLEFKDDDVAACRVLCPQQPGCSAPGGAGGGAAARGGGDEFNGTEWRTGADGKEYKAGDYGLKNWEEYDKKGSGDSPTPFDKKD